MIDDTVACPSCGEPSGVALNFETLGDGMLKCQNCGTPLTVEYEESFDGEEESQFFWIKIRKP